MDKTMEPISINGHRIWISPEGIGYFYHPEDQFNIPDMVLHYYCSICAKENRKASQDGEADCNHKQTLRDAIAFLNGQEDAEAYRELTALKAAARNGTL